MIIGDWRDEVLLVIVSSYFCKLLNIITFHVYSLQNYMNILQFLAMDVSVRTTMKGTAKCDKHCELQNSVSRQDL